MINVVDVLVVGAGTAGYTLALALSKAGRQVAIVDNHRVYAIGDACGAGPQLAPQAPTWRQQ